MKKIFIPFVIITLIFSFLFAGDFEDNFLKIIKNQLNQYGGKTVLINEAFKNESFIINISNAFVESIGIKEKGYSFKKIIEDDEYYLVIYNKSEKTNYKSKDGKIILNSNDDLSFILMIDKKDYKFVTAYYM